MPRPRRRVRERSPRRFDQPPKRIVANFADPGLTGLATAYCGANRDRLIRIKAQYDPANVFRSPSH